MSAAEAYAIRHKHMRRTDVVVEQKLLSNRRLGLVRVSQQGMQFGDPPADAYLLTAPVFGGPFVECEYGGFGIRQRTYAGDYVFQPLQAGASGYADSPVTVQMTVFDGPWLRSLFQQLGDGAPVDFESAAARTWRSGRLDALLHQTWSHIGSHGDQGQAWVDTAALSIAGIIAERAGLKAQRVDQKPLSRAQFGRVHDLVEADLANGLGVAEMAAAAGVSMYHFIRRFRAMRGESPHQFLMARRLNRARELLIRTDNSLSAIAAAVGYSSQAHMTTAFQRAFGRTPAWFRKHR